MLRQAAPTGLSSRSAGLKSSGAARFAEGALADGVQLAARDLQQQLFAAGFPMQPQRPVGRDDRGTGRIGVHPDAAAFDAGAPRSGTCTSMKSCSLSGSIWTSAP